jgi:hypothetical protein
MKRSKHNLSNYKLATGDMGLLYPVQTLEVLPGDTLDLETSALIRTQPLVSPVMHPCTVRFHHWFVPARIVWDKWEDFITGGKDGNNADTIPTVATTGSTNNVLGYMGVPPNSAGLNVNALPVRAYNLIWNEFYRDQDLQDERSEDDISLARVAWRKDYFTAARPFAQKGNDVTLPIGEMAPVVALSNQWLQDSNGIGTSNLFMAPTTKNFVGDGTEENTTYVPSDDLVADLSAATGVTARQFREFFALQRFAEARARYGSRYTEYLRYMGVRPSDARLQRPEYLGGGKQNLQFSEVLQTADTENGVVGDMKGHGITALKTRRSRKFIEEHGYVITLMSIVPKSIYHDGLARFWLKRDKEHFYQKELQSIGQQTVLTGEVYSVEGVTDPFQVFGYTDRFNEYTWTPSTIAGLFRSTLDYWHLGRKFDTTPALNSDFIECNPTKRIFAEQTQDSLLCMINNKVVARRLVKKVSVGRLL